jgi:translation initiation factor 1
VQVGNENSIKKTDSALVLRHLFRYDESMSKQGYRTVWSSEQGDVRRKESQPTQVKSLPPQEQTVYLHRETKGRGGKPVTLLKHLVLSENDLKALAKQLKQACGCGGTVKDGQIEIQGEHREKIAEVLRELGYKVKIAGG